MRPDVASSLLRSSSFLLCKVISALPLGDPANLAATSIPCPRSCHWHDPWDNFAVVRCAQVPGLCPQTNTSTTFLAPPSSCRHGRPPRKRSQSMLQKFWFSSRNIPAKRKVQFMISPSCTSPSCLMLSIVEDFYCNHIVTISSQKSLQNICRSILTDEFLVLDINLYFLGQHRLYENRYFNISSFILVIIKHIL